MEKLLVRVYKCGGTFEGEPCNRPIVASIVTPDQNIFWFNPRDSLVCPVCAWSTLLEGQKVIGSHSWEWNP